MPPLIPYFNIKNFNQANFNTAKVCGEISLKYEIKISLRFRYTRKRMESVCRSDIKVLYHCQLNLIESFLTHTRYETPLYIYLA